jgi:hypothetical protein
MDNPDLPTKTGKRLHWAWFLLLAVVAVGGYWLFRPVKGTKEASIVVSNPIPKSGHRLTLPIVISTAGQTINAAQIFLKFDPKAVQVESIDKEGSFFTVWVKDQPAYSNTTGDISFAGGIFNPGFRGEQVVGNVTLVAKQPLKTKLSFLPNTSVLLNDGKGTAIPLQLKPIEVNIK